MAPRRLLLAALATTVLALPACGSTDQPAARPTQPSTFPAPGAADDAAMAGKMLLVEGDLPSGFAESKTFSVPGDPVRSAKGDSVSAVKQCGHLPDTSITTTASVSGPTWERDPDDHLTDVAVSSSSSLYGDAKDGQDQLTVFHNPSYQLCLRRFVEPLLQAAMANKGLAYESVNANFSTIAELNAGDTYALRIATETHVNRQTLTAYLDVIGVMIDRGEAAIEVFTTGAKPSLDLERQLITAQRGHANSAMSGTE